MRCMREEGHSGWSDACRLPLLRCAGASAGGGMDWAEPSAASEPSAAKLGCREGGVALLGRLQEPAAPLLPLVPPQDTQPVLGEEGQWCWPAGEPAALMAPGAGGVCAGSCIRPYRRWCSCHSSLCQRLAASSSLTAASLRPASRARPAGERERARAGGGLLLYDRSCRAERERPRAGGTPASAATCGDAECEGAVSAPLQLGGDPLLSPLEHEPPLPALEPPLSAAPGADSVGVGSEGSGAAGAGGPPSGPGAGAAGGAGGAGGAGAAGVGVGTMAFRHSLAMKLRPPICSGM